MTYFLVMGSIALSILFTLGWAVSRLVRWIADGFPLQAKSKTGKAGRKPATRSTTTRQTRAAKPTAKVRNQSQAKPAAASQRSATPWRITCSLAKWHGITPFAVVAAFLYLAVRLVEHGMSFRPPHALPDGFTTLVSNLGWLAAGLILLSLLHNLAKWRCHRAEK